MRYVTRLNRFTIGDFPMVCARSGRPATKMVPVQAFRSSILSSFFFPDIMFIAEWIIGTKGHPWGSLPFAEGQVKGVSAVYSEGTGLVTLKGVHKNFVIAVQQAQGTASKESRDQPGGNDPSKPAAPSN